MNELYTNLTRPGSPQGHIGITWVEILNVALHTLRKLEACHVGTDELGNGAVAEVAPVAVGHGWVLGGWQWVVLKEVPHGSHLLVSEPEWLTRECRNAAIAVRVTLTRVVMEPVLDLHLIPVTRDAEEAIGMNLGIIDGITHAGGCLRITHTLRWSPRIEGEH